MRPTDATIPSNYSRLIARELGLSVKQLPQLLRGTGLLADELMQENSLLTPSQQIRVLQNAVHLSPAEEFGLRLGRRLTPLSHGAMGFMAYSSPDLFTALRAIQTFLPTRMSFARLQIAESEDELECTVSFDAPMDAAVSRCMSDALATMFFAVAEFIVGRPVHEAHTHFHHLEPDYTWLYADYIPGGIDFGSPCLTIKLPVLVARVPNASANHENYLMAMQQCEAMLAEVRAQTDDYVTRVKKLMLSHPPGTLTEDEAAAELFMSKRTLARKLGNEGSGFRHVRDQVLSQQAADYLCRCQLPVEAIATLLNYHDSANFRRAFKRWFGMAPGAYRRTRGRHEFINRAAEDSR